LIDKQIYDEKRLLLDLASGDENAYRKIYVLYKDDIYKVVIRYIKSHELAEDISQDIFIKIWEKRGKLLSVGHLRPYLWNFARNHAIDMLRAAGKSEIAMGEILSHFQDNPGFYEDETLERDYKDFIKRTLDSLSPRSREIFVLCREHGKTYEEVAAALGISRSAVRKHMVQSLQKFRDAADNELGISLGVILPFLSLLHH
jgi:RNA polymerase sigma-70 factor (ECF subfamily)